MNGQDFSLSEEELQQYFGFVYQITDKANGRMYIGKKFFWKPGRKKVKIKTGPNKGKSRSVKTQVPSDWRTYYSSNKEIMALSAEDPDRYDREILVLCAGRGECAYMEAKIQFERNVLLDDRYYNEIINLRCNASAVAHLKDVKDKSVSGRNPE